jgi:PilZ domain
MINDVQSAAPSGAPADRDRRQHDRVPGPFDGVRVGALETPLRIFDLSRGGCFVNAMHEQQPGVRFTMRIELPYVGQITVKAVALYRRPEFGYAMRFVDMSEATASRLEEALEQLQDRAPYDE